MCTDWILRAHERKKKDVIFATHLQISLVLEKYESTLIVTLIIDAIKGQILKF